MRRAGAIALDGSFASGSSLARSSSSPTAVAAAKAARLAPPSAATMTAGGQPRGVAIGGFPLVDRLADVDLPLAEIVGGARQGADVVEMDVRAP